MRDISARKRFIESEFAPEDTSVIWLKLTNNHENINNMQIEDMLQFVNGKWSSIITGGGSTSTIPNPLEGVDPNAKVLIMRATLSNNAIIAYGPESASGQVFSDEPFIKGKPNIGAILKKLYPEEPAMYLAVYGYIYNDGEFQSTEDYFLTTTTDKSWGEAEEVVFIAVVTVRDSNSYGENLKPMYSFDWPEGLEELKLTWDDLN